MHKLVILIEKPENQAEFEAGWPEFLHWAEQMPGLRREVSSRVTGLLYGEREYSMVHELLFDDPGQAHLALNSTAGQSAGRTLQAITRGRLALFLADHLEDSLENIRNTSTRHADTTANPDP
jgi:hypothetical protein